MSRTSGSYDSVIRGVSQQAAHDRLPGQHWAQDNMISDPVRGLSRRHGSVRQHELTTSTPITADVLADLSARTEHTLFIHGVEYSLMVRDGSVPASAAAPIHAINKDTKRIMPIQLTAAAEASAREGITTVCSAGQYILMGCKGRTAAATVTDNLKPTAGQHVAWIRGGAYSRTFKLFVTQVGGSVKEYAYTTMKSYYDQPLDTSDILWNLPGTDTPDPSYTKRINDRTNAYNSAVNKHIADAAKDITPENVAQKLAALVAVDYPATTADGAYVLFPVENVILSGEDGGNGEFIRVASKSVTSPEMLTERHYAGKVMTVQPKAAGSIPYYMKAEPTTDAVGFTEVVWRETAGEVVTPTFLFLIGAVRNGTVMIGTSPQELTTLIGTEVPAYEISRSGDTKQRPLPDMFGREITFLHMFQDRLMILAGATIFMSKTGDYFNLFADSMLTVKDDDPIEVFAQGAEDDTITAGLQLDRNLVLFGRRYQYVVPGRESMAPRNAYVGVVSSFENANITSPAAGGSLMFFCQNRESRLTMQQMQPGSVTDRLDAFDVSAQLDGYLTGTPQQIVAQTSPAAVFIKTREMTNGFYVYSFLDSSDQSQRLFDSWSRWTFDASLGTLIGITSDDSGLLALTLRQTAVGTRLVLDRFVRETDISDMPYIDSITLATESTLKPDEAVAVYGRGSKRWLIGAPLADVSALTARFPEDSAYLYAGAPFTSLVDLTSPYLRDYKDRVILDAKLTVSKLSISLTNSAGLSALISTDAGRTFRTAVQWLARASGSWTLNTQAVEEQKTLPVPVMKDNKTYRIRLQSTSWLPMTISVVEWTGQRFTSRR